MCRKNWDLIGYNLGEESSPEWAKIFSDNSKNELSHLILRENHLYKKTGAQLAECFALIPNHITYLDASGNQLHQLDMRELVKVVKGLPDYVKTLRLNIDDMVGRKPEELNELANSMHFISKLRIVDKQGRTVSMAFAENFNREKEVSIQAWINEAFLNLNDKKKCIPEPLSQIILSYALPSKQIYSFFTKPIPREVFSTSKKSDTRLLKSPNQEVSTIGNCVLL